MLRGEKLGFRYGEKELFSNLDLSLEKREVLGVTGKSGSGKSSLLFVLSGLKKPGQGKVEFKGFDLWSSEKKRLALRRREFGFVFQQHFLINYLTVLENVMVTQEEPGMGKDKALEILGFLELKGLENSFPYELSVGQRQRVAVARAFMNDPSVIFADEPTASLDQENARTVVRLLEEYRKKQGSSMVFVTHDRSLVKGFDRLIEFGG